MKNKYIITIALLILVSAPIKLSYAFQLERLIDPFCLFACENEAQNVTNYSTSNVNSNVNSPNSNVITNVNTNPGVVTNPVVIPIVTNPIYTYSEQISPLSVSCYSSPTTGLINDTFYWRSSVSGGNGTYHITWNGSEGLSGYGSSISKRYNSLGTKNASIAVTSGTQTISQNCSSVEVYDYNFNNNYSNNYNRDYYNYGYNSTNYYNSPQLYVSCNANVTFAPIGTNIVWQANATGGNGSYSYNWTGADNITGYSKYLNTSYSSIGVKNALVTVSSGNQTISQICTNTVTIGTPSYYNAYDYTAYNNSNINSYTLNNGFQIACYPDKTTTKIGTPVTWSVEAIAPNGIGNNSLSYIWSGTDNLSGTQNFAMHIYSTVGTKIANVTVIAQNGQRATQACGSQIYINKNIGSKTIATTKTVTQSPAPAISTNSDKVISATSSVFSLSNVPWGIVAIMVIIVLLCMIIYLMFNKNKI
ncbi:MAG: hypothetical protein AAB683_00355 [Patescibacteria group bacterium]